jgi:hypothetical protein
VFHEFWRLGLLSYDGLVGIDWEWLPANGAMTKAPLGGEKTGPNPTDRGKLGGFKRSSQHPDKGDCDEEAEAAFGSIWAGSSAVTWPSPRGAT